MNRWSGMIGFSKTVETAPSVWREEYIERKYYGNFLKRSIRYGSGQQVNDDISISNQLSVLANSYLKENMSLMRYVTISGQKWKITDISPDWPRITLTLGGVFNAEK